MAMHLLLAFGIFSIGYFFWSKYIEKNLNVDCIRPTPAIEKYNRVDFVPTKPVILFGHHFSSIAGIGPIVGPILALKFGWLPTFLWLVLGVVIIGAVHDFASLMVSVRNGGKTIGNIMESYVSKTAGRIYLVFTFLAVVLVIAVFTRIVAESFVVNPISASTSVFITMFAPVFGITVRRLNMSQFFSLLFGVVLISLSLYLGSRFPLSLSEDTWLFLLLSYSFFASWLPVWVILQPRDYLNFFLLFSFLIVGTGGILYVKPDIKLYAFPEGMGFQEMISYVFPFLFVTVACGAVSGFHSLVSSGTTSKQLLSECHARPIGYGAMLFESLLGVISMTALAVFTYDEYINLIGEKGDKVIDAFSYGISRLAVGVEPSFLKNFAVVALSAFALTSLDTAARVGRYLLSELIYSFREAHHGKDSSGEHQVSQIDSNGAVSFGIFVSAFVVISAYFLIRSGGAIVLWQLFGTSNQLLAGFALMTTAIWAKASGYKTFYFFLPALFMFFVTISALVIQFKNFFSSSEYLLASLALVLLTLSIFIVLSSLKRYFGEKERASEYV